MTSNLWKLKLFKKSAEEAICTKCEPSVIIKTADGSTKMLKKHLKVHPKEFEIFNKLEEAVPIQSIDSFLIRENSNNISALDTKILNFIASNCLPFSIVDEKSFKMLLPVNDRAVLQGRRHYSDWVLPRYYQEMRNKMKSTLTIIPNFSFTTDIWSGPADSFISLTAHGIDKHWKRMKMTLCVRPFPGSHTSKKISGGPVWIQRRQKC